MGKPGSRMSPYRSSAFRHDCAVNGCYVSTFPDWEWMRGCFPRVIMPSDVDGLVEINGHFLAIEAKGAGVSIPQPQRWAFKALAAEEAFTVLFIRDTPDPELFEFLVYDGVSEPAGFQQATKGELILWLTTWGENANSSPHAA